MKNYSTIILLAIIWLASCQKKDTTTPDAAKVTFSITSPQESHIYHSGDSVHIKASVSYPSELHGYELKITDTVSGYVVYDNAQHLHNDHFDISEVWPTSGNVAQILRLELITDIDHSGTEAKKTTYFTFQP